MNDKILKVVFRKTKNEIIALFPDHGFKSNYKVIGYVRECGHIEVDYHDIIQISKPATAIDYYSLLREIKNVYYDYEVVIRKKASVIYR